MIFIKKGIRKLRIYLMTKNNYTRWCANTWINAVEEENHKSEFKFFERWWAHKRGFLVSSKRIFGLTKNNYKNYLSDKEYYAFHPINGCFSNWIDDKATFKYVFSAVGLKKYLPEYYFTIENGKFLKMIDCSNKYSSDYFGFKNLLKDKNSLAIKKIAGTFGEGFYKLKYLEKNVFLINNNKIDEKDFITFLNSLENYLVTEYLYPCTEMAKIYEKTPNTFRYVVYRANGKLNFMMGMARFGVESSKGVDNIHAGAVFSFLDENGYFDLGFIPDKKSEKGFKSIKYHPDTKVELRGRIPMWDSVKNVVDTVEKNLPQLKYLGFDFVASTEGLRMIEINSLPSLERIQGKKPLFSDPEIWKFFNDLKNSTV